MEKPGGNRVESSFRDVSRRVQRLESLWQQALEKEGQRLIESGPSGDTEMRIAGVVQCSWLNPVFSDPARAHRRFDGGVIEVRPVVEKFGRRDPAEWLFSSEAAVTDSGWIDEADRPLAWHAGDGRTGTILFLDRAAVASIAQADIASTISVASDSGGATRWTGPTGTTWSELGSGESGPPDEVLRHVSRFGDWTLERWYPARTVATYRLPVLVGGISLSVLLLAGGVVIASWQRKAIRAAEERVSFVNRVSHELRTPLTNLLLNTDLALDGLAPEDGKVRRRLSLIREETSRLSRIVDNVLAFARLERGRTEVVTAHFDVARVVEEVSENFAPLFERKSITCEYDIRWDAGFDADRDAFAQILSNLLSNVEKYAGEGARARVSLEAEGGCLRLEVSDNGPGIAASARQRVFQPFERAHVRVDEGVSGTGLGLAISRELAIRMGGRLDLVNADGGATFRLMLPRGNGGLR